MSADWIGKVIVMQFGTGNKRGMLECRAFADFPTVSGLDEDGRWSSWGAHMSRIATPEEAADYWRDRAMAAEHKLATRSIDSSVPTDLQPTENTNAD